jgi:hypothetical protein
MAGIIQRIGAWLKGEPSAHEHDHEHPHGDDHEHSHGQGEAPADTAAGDPDSTQES